jgi:hypothetical protein
MSGLPRLPLIGAAPGLAYAATPGATSTEAARLYRSTTTTAS